MSRHKNESTAPPGSLERDALDLQQALSELVRVYQFRDRERICYHNISATQCYALSALIADGPLTLKELAVILCLDKSSASRTLDALEQKGYARRQADPGDGRALRLSATAAGRNLHRRIERELAEELSRLLEDYDPGVRQALIGLMNRLTRNASERFTRLSCPAAPEKNR